MDILIHGSSAAAHALAWKLAESRAADHIYCVPGNAGTQALCEPYTGQDAAFSILTCPGMEEVHYAVCAVSDGNHAFFFPAVHIKDRLSCFAEPEFALPATALPPEKGFYTLEYTCEGSLIRIADGLCGPAACLSLAVLRGDLTALLSKMEAGFPDDFSLELRDGTAALIAIEGEIGAKIQGLADLSGDIGVFIDSAERCGDHLRTTGKRALFLCARDKSSDGCLQKLEKAAALVNIQ